MNKPSILLIDPFRNLIYTYKMFLENESYHVQTAMSPDEAFNLFSKNPHHVIVTEYLPPFENTFFMIQTIKKNNPETYIIMVTNVMIDEKTYGRLFDEGIDDLILKPYPPEKILVHIKKGLRQREWVLRKQELEKQSLLDPMTQRVEEMIYNSCFLKRCLRQELKKAKRHQHTFSLILIKPPPYEEMEDLWIAFYTELIRIIRKYIREEDMVGRNNGEISLILPETNQIGSHALLQRLSDLIQTYHSFNSDKILKSYLQTLSYQSYTYPEQFDIPDYLRIGLEDIIKDLPRN